MASTPRKKTRKSHNSPPRVRQVNQKEGLKVGRFSNQKGVKHGWKMDVFFVKKTISWCFWGFYVENEFGDGLLPDFGSYRGKGWMKNCEVLGNANDVFFLLSDCCSSIEQLQKPCCFATTSWKAEVVTEETFQIHMSNCERPQWLGSF